LGNGPYWLDRFWGICRTSFGIDALNRERGFATSTRPREGQILLGIVRIHCHSCLTRTRLGGSRHLSGFNFQINFQRGPQFFANEKAGGSAHKPTNDRYRRAAYYHNKSQKNKDGPRYEQASCVRRFKAACTPHRERQRPRHEIDLNA